MYINEMTDKAVQQIRGDIGIDSPASKLIQALYDEVKQLKEAEAGAQILIKEYDKELAHLRVFYDDNSPHGSAYMQMAGVEAMYWEGSAPDVDWERCEDCNGEYPQITEQEPKCSTCIEEV